MTATKTSFNPYSVVLQITSDPNFFLAKSSNGYDVYGLILTGENAAICSCPAGNNGIDCKHRRSLLSRFTYMTPADDILDDATWAAIQDRIEAAADREAYLEMMSQAA